jgi:hypothetical protein
MSFGDCPINETSPTFTELTVDRVIPLTSGHPIHNIFKAGIERAIADTIHEILIRVGQDAIPDTISAF